MYDIYVYIYIYIGERLEVPRSMEEPWVSLSLSLSDRHKQGEVGHVMLTFMALHHQKMLLRWGCGNVADVVTLKMLLRWGCCYVEDVAYNCFQNGIVGVKSKTPHVHFAHGSLVDYNISMLLKKTKIINTQFHWCLRKHHKMKKLKNIKKKLQAADSISQVCCLHVELIPHVIKL